MCHAPPALQHFLQFAADLPPLPETAQRLIASFGREDLSLRELSALIGQDPALTARLLRLANSARYSPRERITRLQDAAAVVGLGPLRALALGACLQAPSRRCPASTACASGARTWPPPATRAGWPASWGWTPTWPRWPAWCCAAVSC